MSRSRRVLAVQLVLLAACAALLAQWALHFPYPGPVVRPFLPPKLRWPESLVREWARGDTFHHPERAGAHARSFWDYFTRDPERSAPPGRNLVAPADGKLRFVERHGGRIYLVIGLSFWDVHVQRAPCEGTVRAVRDHGDRIMDGEAERMVWMREKLAPVQKIVDLDTPYGDVEIRLITSLSARRLEVWVEPGQKVAKGQRLGRILAGSTVVLGMPERELRVRVGDRLVAGETIVWEDEQKDDKR